MNDQEFKKRDEAMMKKMEPLRSKEVSEGILKGFSASVERRIRPESATGKKTARLVWAPVAVMAGLALFVVLKAPIQSGLQVVPFAPTLELAQAVSEQEIQDEIALLSELGALDEVGDEALLEEEETMLAGEMELTQKTAQTSIIA